jgi:membrane-bound serine protease (ClpP class)
MNLVVFHVRDKKTGEEAFMSEAELSSELDPDRLEKVRPVFGTGEKRFLTMDGRHAVDLKFAQGLVSTREQLLRHYGVDSELVVLRSTALDVAVVILNAPLVTGLLIVLGLVAMYVEFSMPGTFIGGLIGGLCFALFFWSRFLGGTAGWLELILFLGGLVFLGMELFVIPGFGIAGISGVLMLGISLVMAGQSFAVPHTSQELNTSLAQVGIVAGSSLAFLIAAAIVSRYLGAIPVARSLMLEVPQPATASPPSKESAPVIPGFAAPGISLGQQGTADSPLRPAGKARFGNQYVDVVSDGTYVDRGQPVRVVEISGNRVVVREIQST